MIQLMYDNNIAPRGLSDLGHVVEDHIVGILPGKHEESGRAIFRLSRPVNDSEEEQMWLVPVRTVSEVLGVCASC